MGEQLMVREGLAAALLLLAADLIAAKRDRMGGKQIAARGVNDADVLWVMRDTPRDRFVPARAQPGLRRHALTSSDTA